MSTEEKLRRLLEAVVLFYVMGEVISYSLCLCCDEQRSWFFFFLIKTVFKSWMSRFLCIRTKFVLTTKWKQMWILERRACSKHVQNVSASFPNTLRTPVQPIKVCSHFDKSHRPSLIPGYILLSALPWFKSDYWVLYCDSVELGTTLVPSLSAIIW